MSLRARAARFMSALRPSLPTSAVGVVDRGLATFVIVWQWLWMLATPEYWPFTTESVAVAVAVGATRATLLLMLAAHLRGSDHARRLTRIANVAALVAATVVLLVVTSREATPDWHSVATFALLPVGVAGLLFAVRPALGVLVAVIALEVVALFHPFVLDGTSNPLSDLLYPGYALTAGVVSVAARFVLVREARRTDNVVAETVAAEQERRTSEGVQQAIQRRERLLHESVLNTLAAVERGGLTASAGLRARLVARCRESARTFRELLEQAEPVTGDAPATRLLDRDLGGPLADLYTSGVAVHIDCDALDNVPAEVYGALRSAAREALSNVGRHADARSVWLVARQATKRSAVMVSVEIRDDGAGFDALLASQRFGLPVAIAQTLDDAGGTSTVESAPGVGTTVRLEWDSRLERPVRPRFAATFGFAIPILSVFALFTVVSVALSWSDFAASPQLNLAALALYLCLAAILGWASTKGSLRWRVVAPVLALAPLVYQLQVASIIPTGASDWAEWSSVAIASLFLVVAGAGPPWGWLAALCTWLLIQGDVLTELFGPGMAILVAGAVFGRSLRQNSDRLDASVANQVIQRSSLAVARESIRRVQQRYAALRVSDGISLLTGIAEGELDPEDQSVRAHAAVEERFVRTVLRVDPTADAVQALVISLAVRARRRGVLLETDLASTDTVEPAVVEPITPPLVRAIESTVSGAVARLTTRIEGQALALRLLAPIETGEREAMRASDRLGVEVDPDGGYFLWEFPLPLARSAP